MTVKISGVLKDGTGKPVQNCTIVLKARRTSSTVVVNTVASENPDEAGRYSMDVEHGQYSVTLLVEGFPPSHAGTITVYEGSRPGTLNDFLGAMTEDDVRPEALRRFEQMVEEVSRNASAVAQNTAAAKNQPAMPVHQPARRQLMQPMLQPQHVPPARQPDRPRRRLSQRLPAQERHRQRPVKQQKCCCCRVIKKRGSYQRQCRENVRNECRSITKIGSHFCIHSDHEGVRSCHLGTGAAASKEAAKSSETNASSSASSAASSATAAGNSAKAAKRPRRTLSLLKQQRDRAPQLRQVQKQRLHYLPVPRQQVPGWPQPVPPPPENRQKAPHHPLQQPQRRLAKPLSKPLQQRGLLLQQNL